MRTGQQKEGDLSQDHLSWQVQGVFVAQQNSEDILGELIT
jgi:hypothetical protein